MNKTRWIAKEFEWLGRRGLHALFGNYFVNHETYAGQGIVSGVEINDFIYNGIKGDKPFAVGRMGFGQVGILCCAQSELFFNSKVHYHWTPSYIHRQGLKSVAEEKSLKRYYDINIKAMSGLDAIGTYTEMFMADAVLESVPGISNTKIFDDIEILSAMNEYPRKWTHALEGQKVLIVSPFYNEIRIQYEKRDLLWSDGRIPKCELSYDPSIWMRTEGYYKSLEILSERVLSRDFDVALLSCASLGTPLAAMIKESGRKAVQMSSAMHTLFGLKGKRWDNMGIYNEYWIRPGEDTKPSYANDLDGATYW